MKTSWILQDAEGLEHFSPLATFPQGQLFVDAGYTDTAFNYSS